MRSALLALLLVGCGAGGGGGSAAAPFSGSSSSSGDAPAEPFLVIQPEDLRLATAAQTLRANIGHEVTLDVDAGLLKEHASTLQNELSDALETVNRGLEQARAARPDLILKVTSTLHSLRFELDEKARDSYVLLTEEGALIIHVPTQATYFVSDAAVTQAMLSR